MVNQSKMAGSERTITTAKRGEPESPIELEKTIQAYDENNLVKVICRMNPADANSAGYELTIPIFRKGSTK